MLGFDEVHSLHPSTPSMVKQLSLALALLVGQSSAISIHPSSWFHASANSPQQVLGDGGREMMHPMTAAPPSDATLIAQTRRNQWIVKCDQAPVNDANCRNAFDGTNTTYFQSSISSNPHVITIDLLGLENVTGVVMSPRADVPDGRITSHKIFLSDDNITWGDPVALGTWFGDGEDKVSDFAPKTARYVRLVSTAPNGWSASISITELNVYTANNYVTPLANVGRWGLTIDFPIVPVGVWVDPPSGKVISFSSYQHDLFDQTHTTNVTLTATWDPVNKEISQRLVSETHHDMFCPGMAFDVNGRMIITGGETAEKVSVFDPATDTWSSLPGMFIPRGYQGQVTTSDGKIFVIGGSWGPEGLPNPWETWGKRNGEIFDPITNAWTLLPNVPGSAIQTTNDWQEEYRADNHVWLMGWKNGSIFHAGPSQTMHWIDTSGNGTVTSAGKRGTDADAMCGVAVMYDAAKGRILTAGGAEQYKYWDDAADPSDPSKWIQMGKDATTNSFIVTLGKVGAKPTVTKAGGGMKYPRIFGHAVVLPNGDTFVVGGQQKGQSFTDQTPALYPEVYSPLLNKWTTVAMAPTVRVYHSFALLLPDATVMVGGGGLCGKCAGRAVNHFDAQIYIPQYLLNADGTRAKRPTIKSVSAASVAPGATITIVIEGQGDTASLVRYGGATHSLNNDQRRISLQLKKTTVKGQFTVTLPADGGVVIPGPWMLFVFNANGTPSEGKYIQVLVG